MKSIKSVFRYLFILLIALYLPHAAEAQTITTADSSPVDMLVEKMSVNQQLSEVPEEIRLQFEQNPMQLPAETNQQMLKQFDEAYANDLMVDDFKSGMRQKLDDQQQELSQWLNNDYTQSITDARKLYYTLQGKRQRVVTRYEMDQNPPSEQRIKLINTLTGTTSVAQSSVESSVIILRSVIKALGKLSKQQNFSDAQVNAIAANFRTQMQSQAGDLLNRQQLVMFHQVPDEALQNYITFWGTDTGQWLDKTISQSMQAAYQQAADRFLQSVNTDQ